MELTKYNCSETENYCKITFIQEDGDSVQCTGKIWTPIIPNIPTTCDILEEKSEEAIDPTDTQSEENPTDSPSEENPTDSPSEENPTDSPSEENPTDSPSEENPTDSPSEENPTDSPSEENTTDSTSDKNPTDSPSDENPTESPSEENPTDSPSEENPTDSPSEENPTDSPSEENPTDSPSEENPESLLACEVTGIFSTCFYTSSKSQISLIEEQCSLMEGTIISDCSAYPNCEASEGNKGVFSCRSEERRVGK